MSASTVSITANPATARRRSAVEKKSAIDLIGTEASPVTEKLAGNDTSGKDLSHSIRGETVLERSSRDAVHIKKQTLPPNSAALPRRTTRKGGPKVEKPRWQTVVSVFTKNLLLLIVLLGLVQMIRRLALNSGSFFFSNIFRMQPFAFFLKECRYYEIKSFARGSISRYRD